VTKQMWFRKSKYSNREMHLLRIREGRRVSIHVDRRVVQPGSIRTTDYWDRSP
jgi:hypothetical protein